MSGGALVVVVILVFGAAHPTLVFQYYVSPPFITECQNVERLLRGWKEDPVHHGRKPVSLDNFFFFI